MRELKPGVREWHGDDGCRLVEAAGPSSAYRMMGVKSGVEWPVNESIGDVIEVCSDESGVPLR